MKNFWLYIKSLLDRYIYFVPIFMLLATLVTNFVEYNKGTYNYVVVGNAIGYSIIVNVALFYLFNFTNKRYCWFTRKAPIGLVIVNFVDIIGYYMNQKLYSYIFNIFICIIIITLALYFVIKKKLMDD